MRNRCLRGFALVLLFLLVGIALASKRAYGTTYNWTQSTCGFLGCGWSTPNFWSPAGGPPGTGDTATIGLDVSVVLTANTGAMNGLTLENGAAVYTFGNQLNVAGTNASMFLFGTGPTGGNTQLVVNSGAGLGFDFIGSFLSLHQGAELKMQGGGALSDFVINISKSSLISGYGSVILIGTGNKFDMAGTIRPEGGELTIASLVADRLDLDGNVGGDEFGLLDVTADGDLSIVGSLADPYNGIINIGNSNHVEFDTALDMEGQLNFTSGLANQLIAPSIIFYSGSGATIDQAIGDIYASTIWTGNTEISLVNPTDEIRFAGNSNFAFSTVFSGTGRVVNKDGANMVLQHGADVSTRLLNHGTLDVASTSSGSILLEDYQQTVGGRLKIGLGGPLPGADHDQVSITEDAGLSGMLDVSLIDDFELSPGDSFEIVNIDGTLTAAFNSLGEGSIVDTLSDLDIFITYFGGDGNDVVLYVPRPGDFDFDGDVDGFDFMMWQRGQSPNPLSTSDYNDWEMNFGATMESSVAASSVIPEPTSAAMLLLGLALSAVIRRR